MKRLMLSIMLIALSVSTVFPETDDTIISYPRSGIQQLQDPKGYVSRVRFNYNFTYDIYEIEAKAAKHIPVWSFARWDIGFMGAITIFIHPTDGFFGYYPVDNLIGYIGAYAEIYDLFTPGLDLIIYPLAHESTHLVDGYDRGGTETGYLYEDMVFDSNEYYGFDFRYRLNNLNLFAGFIAYLYLPSKPIETVTRPLRFRFHIGEDWTIPINEKLGVIISSDFALFYEDGFHPAINIGTGVNFGKSTIMLHYEYQRGLGQDFRAMQQRFGLEFSLF
jgi:hypothetical protein